MRGGIAIQRDLLGDAPLLDRARKEALGRGNIAVFTQEKINGLSFPIHCTVQIAPLPFDPNVRFLAPPRDVYWSGEALDPTHNSSMRKINMSFRHHIYEVAIT